MPLGPFSGRSTSLFRMSPPKLRCPSGSTDDNVNLYFVRSALGYLRSSTHVRDVIDWDPRPHPFYICEPLKAFYAKQGHDSFEFDPSKTLATIHWVESMSADFGNELRTLYNFGGVLSYSNINERIYHTVFFIPPTADETELAARKDKHLPQFRGPASITKTLTSITFELRFKNRTYKRCLSELRRYRATPILKVDPVAWKLKEEVKPVRYRRPSWGPAQRAFLKHWTQKALDQGLIVSAGYKSAWASRPVLVPKHRGDAPKGTVPDDMRVCMDYIAVNERIKRLVDQYPDVHVHSCMISVIL